MHEHLRRRLQRPAWAAHGHRTRYRTEPPAGGQGGAGGGAGGGSGDAGDAGGQGGQAGGGQGSGDAGDQGAGGGTDPGANANAAAQRLLRKAEQERDEARQRVAELEGQNQSDLEKAQAAQRVAEQKAADAEAKAEAAQKTLLVRSAAKAANLSEDLVADLAQTRLGDLADTEDDAGAKTLVASLQERYSLQPAGEAGQPTPFGQPGGPGGAGGGQGGGGQAGAGGANAEDATGDPQKDYRKGIGRGILDVARSRGLASGGGSGTDDD